MRVSAAKKTMNVSVILCTYNRCHSLANALDSVAASHVPDGIEWEIVVVDNNSTDQTRQVVEGFSRRFPGRFRYVRELQQGLCYARNAGVREARGAILAFTDDDVIVDQDWLQKISLSLQRGKWAGAGGKVVAANEFKCPDWLSLEGPYNLGGVLALFDLGELEGDTRQPPFGANMAFRAQMFEKYGHFRTDLDRSAGSMLSNGDTEFGRRLMSHGERLWYQPSAVVYHGVPDSRLTKSYFLRFWFNLGRSDFREGRRRPDVYGIPRWCFTIPKLAVTALPVRAFNWLFAMDSKRRFFFKGTVWMTFGQMVEMRRVWTEARAKSKDSTGSAGSPRLP